ncbi:MAG: PKD domain-containing protein, partial [Methanomicrobiales archaeon]|nr:PKD domain-containing protein [Methanomicrobiales archaeon]
ANFIADQTSGNAPLTVTFTDTSTGSPTTWIWLFGNGQTSYDRNPEITYQGQGAYTVQLTVEKGGVQSKKSMTINVNPAPSVVKPVTTVVTSEFNNGNIDTVFNSPTKPTSVTFATPVKIISITNYHWNNGKGATPGSIALKHADGTLYGYWSASGEPGQGGVPNANWIAKPLVTVKAGTYTVLDSGSSTWSQNTKSGNAGFTRIVYQ